MIRPKGIIFDFDGVLVDTEWAIYQSWLRLYRREGQDISIETYAPCLGAGYSHWDPAAHLESLTGKNMIGRKRHLFAKSVLRMICLAWD